MYIILAEQTVQSKPCSCMYPLNKCVSILFSYSTFM